MFDTKACDECKVKCSILHGKKKDPSPVVTTFHKILVGDYDFSKYLRLPPLVSQIIPSLCERRDHILEDCYGQQWQVTLGNKDGGLAFEMGWDKFFADHGLKEGYTLAFHYIQSHFVVQIIKYTGFEKLKFPVANRKKRKRSEVEGTYNAVKEYLNISNDLTRKQGPASDSGAITERQPALKDNPLNLEKGKGMYQHVSSADCEKEEFYMINREDRYNYEESRSPLLAFVDFQMQFRVDSSGKSDKKSRPSNTIPDYNAVASTLNKNPVSAEVVTGKQPARVSAIKLSNHNSVASNSKNVAVVDSGHPSVLPIEKTGEVHSENKIRSSTPSPRRVKLEPAESKKHSTGENVKLPKKEQMELGTLPICKHMNSEVVTGEQPARVSAIKLSNHNSVASKSKNVAVVDSGLSVHPSVLPKEKTGEVHSENKIRSSTPSPRTRRVKLEPAESKKYSSENVKLPKKEQMELGTLPICKHMNSVLGDPKSNNNLVKNFGGARKDNEVHNVVKSEPVDSLNDTILDASAISFTVVVGSRELLELPTSVSLWAKVQKKVVNLKGPDGKIWPVLYHHKLGVKALTSGWEFFFKSNRLQTGDECAFVFDNKYETIFRVYVSKVSDGIPFKLPPGNKA